MSKLETVKQIIMASGLSYVEEATQLLQPRHSSTYYRSFGFRVAPKKPVLTAQSLRKLSDELVRQLIPAGPSSISWCSIFAGKRESIRVSALYFSEPATDTSTGIEIRIRVSIFPCQVMAQNVGYRAMIEIGGYECPEPCEFASKCTFKVSKWRTLKKLL